VKIRWRLFCENLLVLGQICRSCLKIYNMSVFLNTVYIISSWYYANVVVDVVASADVICEFCLFLVDPANRDYGPPPPIPPPPAMDAYSSYRGLLSADMVYALYCMCDQFYSFLFYLFAFFLARCAMCFVFIVLSATKLLYMQCAVYFLKM